jgi:hypothetical protein
MNERIRELAEQAGMVKILAEHASEYGNGLFENTPYPELEKFAELIVRECADVILEWKGAPFTFDEDLAVRLIKQHLGVK